MHISIGDMIKFSGYLLTGDYYKITKVTLAITSFDTRDPLPEVLSFNDQGLKFSLRLSQNKLNASLLTQKSRVNTGLGFTR